LLFEAPDPVRFPALRLAREAGMAGGTLPAVMNAANEVAVERFLQEKGSFPEIWQTVESVMQAHENIASPGLDAILRADQWARNKAGEYLNT
jgi:1-deoxy-D-xylulose-5-phosphate reductoisomerase